MGKQRKYCLACNSERPEESTACPVCGGSLHVLRDDDLTGQIIDNRYRLTGLLGKGGMGVVYKARHDALDRTVAVKFLRRDLSPDEQFVKRFLQEARAVARLRSPHTVMVYDFGTTPDGLLYFAMEYCDGRSLHAVLRKEGRLDWKRAARMAVQVCASLAEAHDAGILHRDIKPENIFLARDKEGNEQVKVLDFGIARLVSDKSATRITRQGLVVGTPEYLSPEQATGQAVDSRSDIYSLGVVLYEAVSGKRPFASESTANLLVMHVQTDPPPLHAAAAGVEVFPPFEDIVMRCLAKRPEDRPQSARELGRLLRELLDGSGGETAPDSPQQDDATRREVPCLCDARTEAYEPQAEPPAGPPQATPVTTGASAPGEEGRSPSAEVAGRMGLGKNTYSELTHATTVGIRPTKRQRLIVGVAAAGAAAVLALLAATGFFKNDGPGRDSSTETSEGSVAPTADRVRPLPPVVPAPHLSPAGIPASGPADVAPQDEVGQARCRDAGMSAARLLDSLAPPDADVRAEESTSELSDARAQTDAGPGSDVTSEKEAAAPAETAKEKSTAKQETTDVGGKGRQSKGGGKVHQDKGPGGAKAEGISDFVPLPEGAGAKTKEFESLPGGEGKRPPQ